MASRTSKTVVRAGYGASTIPFPDNRYAFNYPVKQNYSGTAANGFQRAGSMATGFPAPSLVDIPPDGIIPVAGSLLELDLRRDPDRTCTRATLHSWNVAFQRQLPYSFTADIAYVGNRGVDLVMDVDANASLVYGSGNVGRPQFAPFNRTGTSRTRSNDNKSQYNALQMKVDRRFRTGCWSRTRTRSAGRWTREREHDDRHADRLRSELGAVELRSHAQLRR